MFTLVIQTNLPEGLQKLTAAVENAARSHEAFASIARAGSQLTREHLYDLANSRHRSQVGLNFYADAADATSGVPVADGAEIRIDKAGIAQRYYGGDIDPVNRSHLWIPAEGSSAEGKAPGEFWPFDHIVINSELGTGQGFAEKDGEILFWLVNHVHQEADPSVLPTDDEFGETASTALADLAQAVWDSTQPPEPK